ncbi:putative ArsR family transcriptional regulator [Gordonia araii NBRC 100433]|uniref:Putative ArsR family transcriptional regulator n=1 Tax=Gordonia araii NBRC 100433 TaxID=1073574 RepID=G7H4L4_9ACTN|nr:metalloregulator ArsR/SmtB family transcription factor [Gordonia araii]NNG96154.1 helix-turn-helix transcriptional regulator [Gordonia araii NBRC 100433]GAB10789.1 putative ArsR family transcriptional regulator [Gordonia araii NBRC 100433]
MTTLPHSRTAVRTDPAALEAASDLLRALAAPTRIAIVMLLAESPRCVHQLVDELGLNQPQVSQHLRVLRDLGLVDGRRRGREVEYALVDDHVAHIATDAIVHACERVDDTCERPEAQPQPIRPTAS